MKDNERRGKIPLSVAIITKDEEEKLPGCLDSVAFADQIVVVDSGSTDKTVAVAKSRGCEVWEVPWRGFGPQKQFAVDRCRHDWVLVLDADERVEPEAEEEIRKIVLDPSPSIVGYSFPRRNIFQGRWIRHGGWWPDRVLRLFLKEKGGLTEVRVHEAIRVEGKTAALPVPLLHLTEGRLSPILAKINHYSTEGAREAHAAGRRSSLLGACLRAKLAFLHNYFLRCGFLDGRQGLILALLDGINKFFKYAKLAELGEEKQTAAEGGKDGKTKGVDK